MRPSLMVAGGFAVAAMAGSIAALSCRSSRQPTPPPGQEGPALVLPPAGASGAAKHGDGLPAPAPAAPRSEAEKVLEAHGIQVPGGDDDVALIYKKLVDVDDATLRQILVAIAKVSALKGKTFTLSHRRVELPAEFGARLLRLATPFLKKTPDFESLRSASTLDDVDEDLVYGIMLVRVLEKMQYGPALAVLMRPCGAPLLGPDLRWDWAQFGPAAVEPLAQLARSTKGTDDARRDAALSALAQIRDPEAVPALQRLLQDHDPEVRARAMEALRESGTPLDVSQYRRVLESPTSTVYDREQAALTIAKAGGAEDLEYLMQFVEGVIARPGVRDTDRTNPATSAIEGLIERREPRSLAWVLQLVQRKGLDKEANDQVRNSAIRTLGGLRVSEAKQALLGVLEEESDALSSREYAGFALAKIDPSHEDQYSTQALELEQQRQKQKK